MLGQPAPGATRAGGGWWGGRSAIALADRPFPVESRNELRGDWTSAGGGAGKFERRLRGVTWLGSAQEPSWASDRGAWRKRQPVAALTCNAAARVTGGEPRRLSLRSSGLAPPGAASMPAGLVDGAQQTSHCRTQDSSSMQRIRNPCAHLGFTYPPQRSVFSCKLGVLIPKDHCKKNPTKRKKSLWKSNKNA